MTQEIIDFCDANDITVDQFYGKEIIDHSMDLYYLTSIPDGFNPNINGYLNLINVKLLPDNFTPTIKGNLYLYLNSISSIGNNFNPKIGGVLCINAKIAEELLINYNYNIYCYNNYSINDINDIYDYNNYSINDINDIYDYMIKHNLNYFEAGFELQDKIILDKFPKLKTYINALNRNKKIDNILN
jgi:hypothetical protein